MYLKKKKRQQKIIEIQHNKCLEQLKSFKRKT